MPKGMQGFQKGNKFWLNNIGKHPSAETLIKLSEAQKGEKHHLYGKHHSEETKKKISQALLGEKNWSFGRIGERSPKFGKPMSAEVKRKLYESNKGKHPSEETRIKLSIWQQGENNPNWKGGISQINNSIRNLVEYMNWRAAVFKRDNYICQICGDNKGRNLNSHHIKQLSEIINENNIKEIIDAINCKELWDINNGITLCEHCHLCTGLHKDNSGGGYV